MLRKGRVSGSRSQWSTDPSVKSLHLTLIWVIHSRLMLYHDSKDKLKQLVNQAAFRRFPPGLGATLCRFSRRWFKGTFSASGLLVRTRLLSLTASIESYPGHFYNGERWERANTQNSTIISWLVSIVSCSPLSYKGLKTTRLQAYMHAQDSSVSR